MTEITATHDGWVLCHDNQSVLHVVPVRTGNKLYAGQPIVEEFLLPDAARDRVARLVAAFGFDEETAHGIINANF